MNASQIVLGLAAAYGCCGLIFGVVFVSKMVRRVDPAAEGASVWFRLIILPGAVAWWPLLLFRLVRSPRSGDGR